MHEHTPGPWTFEMSTAVGGYAIDLDGDIVAIAENEADARLIAAAPELLAVAEQAFAEYSGQLADAMRRGNRPLETAWRQRVEEARAVIATAQGETDACNA